MSFEEMGTELGQLVAEKNKAYGNAFEKCGEFLKLLWPDGVPVDAYLPMLALVRIFDKQVRIATDPTYGGESPFKDIAGYGLLGWALNENEADEYPATTRWVGKFREANIRAQASFSIGAGQSPAQVRSYLHGLNDDCCDSPLEEGVINKIVDEEVAKHRVHGLEEMKYSSKLAPF